MEGQSDLLRDQLIDLISATVGMLGVDKDSQEYKDVLEYVKSNFESLMAMSEEEMMNTIVSRLQK